MTEDTSNNDFYRDNSSPYYQWRHLQGHLSQGQGGAPGVCTSSYFILVVTCEGRRDAPLCNSLTDTKTTNL